VRGEHAARVPLGDIGKGMSPFPFVVIYPQDEHEELLIEWLRREGIEIERSTELDPAALDEARPASSTNTPCTASVWKRMLRFSADPKRWIAVTAPPRRPECRGAQLGGARTSRAPG
jgi:hypothetical protein